MTRDQKLYVDGIIAEIAAVKKSQSQEKDDEKTAVQEGIELDKKEKENLQRFLEDWRADGKGEISGEIQILRGAKLQSTRIHGPGKVLYGDTLSANLCVITTDAWTVKVSGGVKHRFREKFEHTPFYSMSYRSLKSLPIHPESHEIANFLIEQQCEDAPNLKILIEYMEKQEQYPIGTSLVEVAVAVLRRRMRTIMAERYDE